MRPLITPRCRGKHNIKMVLKEIKCEDVNRIHIAQDRVQWYALVKMIMNFCIS